MTTRTAIKLMKQAFDKAQSLLLVDLDQISQDSDKLLDHYISCVQFYQELQKASDEIIHTQKRLLAYELLQITIVVLLSTKQRVAKIPNYGNLLDEKLSVNGLLREDLTVKISDFLVDMMTETNKEWLALASKLDLTELQLKVRTFQKQTEPLTMEDAVQNIMRNELGRQARLQLKIQRDLKRTEVISRTKLTREEAVILLQKLFRGKLARKKLRETMKADNIFIGMEPAEVPISESDKAKLAGNLKARQMQAEISYKTAIAATKQKIERVDAVKYRDNWINKFRTWYIHHKQVTGSLPEFPTKEVWMVKTFEFDMKPAPVQQQNQKGKPAAAPAKGKDAVVEPPKEKPFESRIKELVSRFVEIAEGDAYDQNFDEALIFKELFASEQEKIKNDLYDVLLEEYQRVKSESEGKKKGKEKAPKQAKVKAEKSSKLNPEEAKTLLTELATARIVQKTNLTLETIDLMEKEPILSRYNGQPWSKDMLIQILGEIGLLRLSVKSEYLGEIALPNSLLLYLSNSASKAVEFIHSKSKCLLFNISPEVLSQTQDAVGLLQKAFKVAKTVSPAIIVMNQIEQVFYKKSVPDNGLDPKVLKKELQKQLKNLKVTDQVLFIGLALEPWLVDAQTLCSVFDVSACIPPADNSARYRAWKKALPEAVRKRLPGRPSALSRALPGMEQELIDKFVYEMKVNDFPETKFNEKVSQFFVESNIPEESPLKTWVKALEAPATK